MDVSSRVYPADGPWGLVETTGPRRTFYYRDSPDRPRYEEILPSGRLLVDDFRGGEIVETVFTAQFDWNAPGPKGKPLGDRALQKRQAHGEPWFESHFQQVWRDERMESRSLVLVCAYVGLELRETREFGE
jgi:hypothetical protein